MGKAQRLILASASEGRRYLLSRAGYDFEIMPSGIDEPTGDVFPDPRSYVQHVAWLKAAAVAPRLAEGLVLAADSTSWLNGRCIGKPADRDDARRILAELGGSTHELWTGVCLWQRPGDRQMAWQERSLVRMKAFAPDELEAYLDSGVWQGKAGAYAIQESGDPYIDVVQGSVSNVIGLPIETLQEALNRLES